MGTDQKREPLIRKTVSQAVREPSGMEVKGSAIRALRKGQKAFLSNFLSLKSVLTATLARVLPADPFTEFSSLSNRIPRDSREGDPFSQPSGSSADCADACLPSFRTERSGLNDSSLGSFRSGFLGHS